MPERCIEHPTFLFITVGTVWPICLDQGARSATKPGSPATSAGWVARHLQVLSPRGEGRAYPHHSAAPCLAQLLVTLPRVNDFVFASTDKTGRIVDVRSSHERVLRSVGIEHLTFHGLRRAYKQRGRSVVPHGAVDQIQGHRPSGTADGYAILPIDDLRPFAERIEAHILELAGVEFDATLLPGRLQAVA